MTGSTVKKKTINESLQTDHFNDAEEKLSKWVKVPKQFYQNGNCISFNYKQTEILKVKSVRNILYSIRCWSDSQGQYWYINTFTVSGQQQTM